MIRNLWEPKHPVLLGSLVFITEEPLVVCLHEKNRLSPLQTHELSHARILVAYGQRLPRLDSEHALILIVELAQIVVRRSRDDFINELIPGSVIVARCGFGIGTCPTGHIANMFGISLCWSATLWAMGKWLFHCL
jgi:hypothetical protein